MEKPKISVRKPPPSADDYVSGGLREPAAAAAVDVATVTAVMPSPEARPSRGMVRRQNGEQLRRFTVYLQPEDAELLERRCAEHHQQLSAVLADVIRKWLRESAHAK